MIRKLFRHQLADVAMSAGYLPGCTLLGREDLSFRAARVTLDEPPDPVVRALVPLHRLCTGLRAGDRAMFLHAANRVGS